jgi:hypothetical protein
MHHPFGTFEEIDSLKKLKRLEVYGQKASDFKEVTLLIIGIIKNVSYRIVDR